MHGKAKANLRSEGKDTLDRPTPSRLTAFIFVFLYFLWAKHSTNFQEGGQLTELELLVKGGSRVTRAAHLLWDQFVKAGDFVVDGTCGNGSDSLWLSRAVGPTGRVLAFDIQVGCSAPCQNLTPCHLRGCTSEGILGRPPW